MKDLLQAAKMFEASVKLQDAATILKQRPRVFEAVAVQQNGALTVPRRLDDRERAILVWAANMLVSVDWHTIVTRDIPAQDAEIVSKLRPAFYNCLLMMEQQGRLSNVNIVSVAGLAERFRVLDDVLMSGDFTKDDEIVVLAADIFRYLSMHLLVECSRSRSEEIAW